MESVQAEIVRHVEEEKARPGGDRVEVKKFPGYVTLRIPEEDQHFWSPLLHLSLEPLGESKTVISGIYGPNANVWSIFLYGYLFFGTLSLFAGLLGISQWIVGVSSWGLYAFAGLIAAVIGLYFLAQFGQKLAARQTYLLHLTYEAAIGRSVEIR